MNLKFKFLRHALSLFLIIQLSSTSSSFAQNKLWDKTYGGKGEDQLTSMQQTSDGGYILGGASYSGKGGDKSEANRGGKNQNGSPYSDYWIVKLKADGTKEWDKTFGGTSEDVLTALQQTQDGGYLLGGRSNSSKSGDKTQNNKGEFDFWVIKIRANGTKVWDKTFGGSQNDKLTSLQQTTDGGYILGGYSDSGVNGDKSEATTGAWIVKINTAGTKVWDKSINSGGVVALQQTRDGGYVLGSSGNDYRIVKLNATGGQEWEKTLGGNKQDELKALQQTQDGGYILGGTSESGNWGDKSEASKGYRDYWIVKLNANGSKEWDKTIGGESDDNLTSVQQTSDGGYILGGFSVSGKSGDKTTDKLPGSCWWSEDSYICGYDYWIIKLRPNGTAAWDKSFNREAREYGAWDDFLISVQQTTDDGYILGGYSWFDEYGDQSEEARSSSDFWIIRLGNKEIELNQVITFEPILDKTLGDAPFPLSAFASSGLPITFSVVSGRATIQGNVITLTGTGTVKVRALQAGNSNYNSAEVIRSFLVEAPSVVKKQWDKTIGGDQIETLSKVLQTSDGGYILGGSSSSGISGEKSEINRGNNDYWIVKLKADGTKEWDKTFGGDSDDILASVQQTSDGGYILGGTSYSGKSGDKSEANRGELYTYDYWVVKVNANGSKEWDKTFGGNDMDNFTSLEQTSDGGYILGGTSSSGKNGDKSTPKNDVYFNDYWIIKTDNQGKKVWDDSYGGISSDELKTVHQTPDGGYILGGWSLSGKSGDKSETNHGTKEEFFEFPADYWIVKLKADGTKEWDKTFGGDGDDLLQTLQQTSNGGYILGGSSYSDKSGDKTQTSRGMTDYWIVRLRADGSKEWEKTVGGDSEDELAAVQETEDSGYILGGYSYSGKGGDKSGSSKFGSDYWVVKLQANGTKEWDKTFGGESYFGTRGDELYAVLQTNNEEYILAGSSNSDRGRDKSEYSRGESDFWIIKIKEDHPRTTSWNLRYGGKGADNFTSVIKTSDSGYLSGGYTNSGASGDKSQISQGKNDYWIVKSDKNGKKQWDKSYGGTGEDYLNSIVQTSDGGYLLAGSSLSGVSGDKTQESRGERDYWVVKVDKHGNKLWDKRYGGSGTEDLKQVILMPSGSFILAGTSNSPLSGDISQPSLGQQDYWVLKINRSGKKIWDQRYGGSLNDNLEGLILTQDGGFLVGGTSASGISGTKSQASQGSSDYWVVRITGEGEKVWDKTYGGSGEDQLMGLGSTNTSSGNFFLAGTSTSGKSGDKSQTSQGGKDYWLVKITGTGKKIWDKRYGGSQDEELRTIHMTPEGGYLLGGSSTSGVSGDKSQVSQGASDYWMVKTTATGVQEWDQRYGGSGKEELRSVLLTSEGGYLLAGRSDSGVSGDRTQPSQGSTDYWLVKVAPTATSLVATREATGGEEPVIETPLPGFRVYPNPAREHVNVRFTLPETQPATVKVYDSQGQEITTLFQGEAKANQTYHVEWPANTQASGMYLLQLQTPTKRQHCKLLLAK